LVCIPAQIGWPICGIVKLETPSYGKISALGGMTERLKVTVLKTVVVQATVGSNPTPSAELSHN
jgi:hypothetical protein